MINDLPKVDHLPVEEVKSKGGNISYRIDCPKEAASILAERCPRCPYCRIDNGTYVACAYHRDEARKRVTVTTY